MDEEKREYIALLREGYIDKEQFMELMRAANSPAPSKKKPIKKQFTFNFPSVLKKAVPVAVVVLLLFSVLTFITPVSRAASPVVAYSSITDGEQFVDVIPGEGVYLTVNVSDSDGNLQSVNIYTNASGSWSSIYSSGALGGVSYHNTSSFLVSSWTGSWTRYWFNITANDGSDTEFVYSFTTEYVWGQPHIVMLHDDKNLKTSVLYKNTTNSYYLWVNNGTDRVICVKQSLNGVDFAIKSPTNAGVLYVDYIYNAFTYNNQPHIYYYTAGNQPSAYHLCYLFYNTSAGAWQTGDTGIRQYVSNDYHAYGADVKYYDGKYQLVAGYATSANTYLRYYQSTNPLNSFSHISTFDEGYQWNDFSYYSPSLNILNGKLILTYIDAESLSYTTGRDLHWQVYDGVSWTDKGDIEQDLGTSSEEIQGHWQSCVRDLVNNQLICVYINSSGYLLYRTLTNPASSWSDPHIVYTPVSGETIKFPHVDYMDSRIIITFSSNLRGNYNVYYIATPDYVESVSGFNTTYNRIQWVDAAPGANNVNSTVVSFKNMNDRDIKNITWHFEDIGDITVANNVRVWSNMSGSWQSWNVGSDRNTSKIDISAVKGSEWSPGETLYWKFEILNVGNVVEDLHATDEDIYMLIEF